MYVSVVKAWFWLKSSINTTMGLIDSRDLWGGWVGRLIKRKRVHVRERERERGVFLD